MKNAGLILVFLAAALTVIASTELREEIHWQWTSFQDSPSHYASFLARWPDSEHSAKAATLFDDRSWAAAVSVNTPEAFMSYLRVHPSGEYARQAVARIDALHWQRASEAASQAAFEEYLQSHPGGTYAAQASLHLEGLRWRAALDEHSIRAYIDYLEAYAEGRYRREAMERIASLRSDDDPFRLAERDGTRRAYEAFLAAFPGHKRESQARARLQDIDGRDLFELLAENKVEVRPSGSGIRSISLQLRRLVDHDVNVLLPVGTYFVSQRASAQNMVSTGAASVMLDDDTWHTVSVSAACANRTRDIPDAKDSFSIRRAPQQAELQKLMPVLQEADAEYAVRQAAVWIITDNADYGDLGILISGYGGRGPRVIREAEAAQAMKIVSDAGVDIRRKAIWQDRQQILSGLKDTDGSLRSWLASK